MRKESSITSSFTWTSVDKISNLLIQFVLGIIIARLVTPSEYGILGILMVFINLSQVFIDSGLSSALIFRNKLEPDDLNTVFSFNVVVCTFLFFFIFVSSPFIENFYDLPKLAIYLRVSSLILFVNSLIDVPTSIFKIKLDFQSLAISNVLSTITGGILGVIFAYLGYGVWALIIQLLSKGVVQLLLLYIQCHWIPKFKVNFQVLKSLYRYGVNIFGASCLTKIIEEGASFIIAKALTPFNLGLYSRGMQFAALPSSSIGGIITTALFPSLSSIKNDENHFNEVFHKVIEYQAAICIPLFLWIAMIAHPLIEIMLTMKWIAVVPVLQIMCIGRILVPAAYISEQVLNSKGRSDLFLKQQIVKMMVKGIVIVLCLRWGIIGVAIGEGLYTILQFFITNYYAKKVTTYVFFKQLKTMCPYIVSSILSAGFGYLILFVTDNNYFKIAYSMVIAIIIYIIVVKYIFRKKVLDELFHNLIISRIVFFRNK